MYGPLPDPATGHLDNCPLDHVLAHEFGHWIAIQNFDGSPDTLVIHGIVYGDVPVVTKGSAVPFWTSLAPRIEEVALYTAGHVAERLYRESSLDPATLLESFRGDDSCAHDLQCALTIARSLSTEVDGTLETAIRMSYDLLLKRLGALVAETNRTVELALASRLERLDIQWSPELAARLCGNTPDWYG